MFAKVAHMQIRVKYKNNCFSTLLFSTYKVCNNYVASRIRINTVIFFKTLFYLKFTESKTNTCLSSIFEQEQKFMSDKRPTYVTLTYFNS